MSSIHEAYCHTTQSTAKVSVQGLCIAYHSTELY
jgi:hypothetical protein